MIFQLAQQLKEKNKYMKGAEDNSLTCRCENSTTKTRHNKQFLMLQNARSQSFQVTDSYENKGAFSIKYPYLAI